MSTKVISITTQDGPVEVRVDNKVVFQSYTTLELSQYEVESLIGLTGLVGGPPASTYRKHTALVHDTLLEALDLPRFGALALYRRYAVSGSPLSTLDISNAHFNDTHVSISSIDLCAKGGRLTLHISRSVAATLLTLIGMVDINRRLSQVAHTLRDQGISEQVIFKQYPGCAAARITERYFTASNLEVGQCYRLAIRGSYDEPSMFESAAPIELKRVDHD